MKFLQSLAVAFATLAFVNAAPITHEEIVSKAAQGLRLLSLEEGVDPVWKTEEEKLDLLREGKQFFDVTEGWEEDQELLAALASKSSKKVSVAATFPAPSHQSQITPLLSQLSTSRMSSYLDDLSSFYNRYYTTSTGEQASIYIRDLVASFANSGVDVSLFSHSWRQPSIVARIPGTVANSPVTIIGAHMDSINLRSPSSGRAQGMDDDGSGSVNLIDIFRVLMNNNFKPSTPVEFHWYAAEEVGLLGSQAIARSYANSGVTVKAFMQLDMTAFFRPGSREVIALEADYIDSGLNSWLKNMIPMYSSLPVVDDIPCGYACSDHASWYRYGYPTSMPFEAVTGDENRRIHTDSDVDTLSGFSWSHSLEFAKVGLAFIYEMSA